MIAHAAEYQNQALSAVRLEDNRISVATCLGVALFVVAFFLPAVSSGTYVLRGWECAVKILQSKMPMFIISGLTNPLFLVYVVLRLLGKARKLQALMIVAITFVCLPVTWWMIIGLRYDSTHIFIEIGHVFWVVGIVLLTAPELNRWKIHLQMK